LELWPILVDLDPFGELAVLIVGRYCGFGEFVWLELLLEETEPYEEEL
jgi:hypothetical protein